MIDALLDPWREPLMRHALLELICVGASCGALGVWVVLYGLSYGAESLSHAMFPGLVAAALLGLPLALGRAGGLVGGGAGGAPGGPAGGGGGGDGGAGGGGRAVGPRRRAR